ncbi:sulfatase-like hydrolase/transferase [uncultured Draconibacterium sp.]|uniref:sulfatase family protein n=1 Tax=uncultured Draconibacterium sp. TaxID=1573823 RepID=UPI0029C005BF|nr:sulfatase-like hydrolase/transferase [uncultured Draconibacterium sp.]
MDKKRLVLLGVLVLIISSLGGGDQIFASEKKSEKPNIIIIYTDQQRYNTIHSLGNEFIKTPNLDKLVKSGTAFTHTFVTAPVCVASRWSLHTGMYTTSHQTYSNHHKSKVKPKTSLPAELKKNGYQTVLLGKNHCFLSSEEMDIIEGVHANKNLAEDKRSAEKAMPWNVEEDDTHLLTNKAIDVFKTKGEKPVFMWLSYLYPHTPFLCPEPYFSMYNDVDIPAPKVEKDGLKAAGKPFRQQFHQTNTNKLLPYDEAKTMRMKRTYYGMISMIDAEIGRLLQFLDNNNLRDNTIIVFTSDHGDYQGDHGMYTKSPAMYDCLTRVPFICSWKGQIQADKINHSLVSSTDIMPTILDLIQVEIPAQVQGKSLVAVLNGEKEDIGCEYVFSEYGIPGKPILKTELEERVPGYNENPIDFATGIPWEGNPVALSGRFRMIRSKDYKLVEEIGGTNEFYDLKNDPDELVNLFGKKEYEAIQNKMFDALHLWKNTLPGIEKDFDKMGERNFVKYIQKRKKQ